MARDVTHFGPTTDSALGANCWIVSVLEYPVSLVTGG